MRFYVTYAKPIIECSNCGVRVEASSMAIGQWCYNLDELHRVVGQSLPDIPVGWSSNGWKKGKRDFNCTSCTIKE